MTRKIVRRALLILIVLLIIYSLKLYITQPQPQANMLYHSTSSKTTILGTQTSR